MINVNLFNEQEIDLIKNLGTELKDSANNNYKVYVQNNVLKTFQPEMAGEEYNIIADKLAEIIAEMSDNYTADNMLDIVYEAEELMLSDYRAVDEATFIRTCVEYIQESYDAYEEMSDSILSDALRRALYYKFISQQDDSCQTLNEKADWLYTACENNSEYFAVLDFLESYARYFCIGSTAKVQSEKDLYNLLYNHNCVV